VSLFVKENAIIFPGLVILYHLAFRKKPKIIPLLSIILITVIYLIFRASLSKTGTAGMSATTILQRVPGFLVALSIYMRILPLPFDLYMGRENAIFVFNHPQVIIGGVIFIALAATAILCWKRYKIVFFAIGWFFICIAPVSNLYPIAFYMADHYLYLPSIGFFLLVGRGFRILYGKESFKFISIIGVTALTIYFSYLTVIQNYYWKDPVFFYRRTLAYAPYSARMYSNLAKEYGLDKNVDKAIELYKTAVKVDPTHTVAWYNLGVSYFKLGKYDEAIEYCKKAAETDPKYAHSYNIIGASYLTMGKLDDAIEYFKKALAVYPNHVDTMLNLSTAYYKKGAKEESANMLKSIIEKNPGYPTAYSNLGFIYAEKGNYEEAMELYKKAIELDPKYIDAYNNMAFSLYKTGKPKEAVEIYQKVLSIKPDNKQARENLAILEKELSTSK
ncbi:MAG TPA: tetratricopeptide repeat protein, partial [Candidatus Omnitrophota bacterium]|nr:tetratricopeptide repeat protein [Candidatus Omnitrophota bacterium]